MILSDRTDDRGGEFVRPARSTIRDLLPYGLLVLAILLGWQILTNLMAFVLPPGDAARLVPSSAHALSRASESAFEDGRLTDATDLALMSLVRNPFDVRAVRVIGLSTASTDVSRADKLITLAGNWSLRDTPAHIWLISRRLQTGDYVGAFGHADMLARRSTTLRPQLFELFIVAAVEDPRSIPALTARLSDNPPWRAPFLDHLSRASDRGAEVQAVLAAAKNLLTVEEIDEIYAQWLVDRRLQLLKAVMAVVDGPSKQTLRGGNFESSTHGPFGWTTHSRPGLSSIISKREDGIGRGVFVESDAFRGGPALVQHTTLDPGRWRLASHSRVEALGGESRLAWRLSCVDNGSTMVEAIIPVGTEWRATTAEFEIPQRDCQIQRLELMSVGGERRRSVSGWFDDITLAKVP